jgi:simple sugar transport system permease protein
MSGDMVVYGGLAASLLAAVLRAGTPIVFAALGALVSDLAGCTNVALEGLMLTAAFTAVMVSLAALRWFPGLDAAWAPWIGAAAGLAAALLLTAVLAVFHLELGADVIVAGVAVNLLASGLTVLLLTAISGDKGSSAGLNSPALPSLRIPVAGHGGVLDMLLNGEHGTGHHVLIYLALLSAAGTALFLARTRWGVWIRAVGEHRDAALAAGIPVKRMQYTALLISGTLAGCGGIYLSMGYLQLFQADMTAGRGFLGLAAIFLGARRAAGTCAAALLFGASAVLATRLGVFDLPSQLVNMLPPAITILALLIAGRRRPTAKGTPHAPL